jgi:hypothetical protein
VRENLTIGIAQCEGISGEDRPQFFFHSTPNYGLCSFHDTAIYITMKSQNSALFNILLR